MKDFLKLIFGNSIFNRYRKNVNFWFRPNFFGCIYLFILFPTLFAIVVGSLNLLETLKSDSSNSLFFFFAILLFVIIYKIIVSGVRYLRVEIPVWKYVNESKPKVATPWQGANIFFFFIYLFPQVSIDRYESLSSSELLLHKRQQKAKFLYNMTIFIISLILMKITIK